jgi:metallo-beta-lactamase family protein
VLESTYGDRTHDHGDDARRDGLARIINESVKRGGILIIPSFAVERSQELLYYIRELEDAGRIPVLPVYLDSPMAVSATEIFEKWKLVYDMEARMQELEGKHIMQTRMLHVVRDAEESKLLHNVKGPAIFISASGMLEGGRILHHLEHRLPFAENTVLFVGYQAEGTRGRSILNGNPTVKIHGQIIPVHAKIENITGFSGHADYKEILA